MQPFTIGSKTVSIFPSIEPEAPITYLNTFSDEGQKVYGATQPDGCPPFTLVASVIWTGTTTWCPGTVHQYSETPNPVPAEQTTIYGT